MKRNIITVFILCLMFSIVNAQQSSMTGILGELWGDAVENGQLNPNNHQHYYTLKTDDGQLTLLSPDSRLDEFVGQRITVTGSVGISNSQYPLMMVDTITSVDQRATNPRANISGNTPWVTILCRYGDSTNVTPHPKSWYEGLMGSTYPGLGHYWAQVSMGNINLDGSQVVGWYNLPQPRSYYIAESGEIDWSKALNDCTAVADNDVYFPDYYGINMMFNENIGCCAWGATGWYLDRDGVGKGYGLTWLAIGAHNYQGIVAHEMGHGYDLPHSAAADGVNAAVWDVMSNAVAECRLIDEVYSCIGVGTMSYNYLRLGWVPDDRLLVLSDGESAEVVLERLNYPSNVNHLTVKIPIAGVSGVYYTVEARKLVGYDGHLPDSAVIIYKVDKNRPTPAWVVDADSQNDASDEGAMWRVGETFYDATYNITVTVVADETNGYRVRVSNNDSAGICMSVTSITYAECNALVDLYENNGGETWTDAGTWLTNNDPCIWEGVTCNGGHVTTLELQSQGLTEELPSSIGDLTFLTWLNLSYNNLTGSLPATVDNLDNLVVLILNDNALDGALPEAMGSMQALEWVGMWHNHISGTIPTSFVNLSNLTHFLMGVNQISGSIPSGMGSLPNLEYFDVSYNQVSGVLPATFGTNANMTGMNFAYNMLTITDPTLISKLQAVNPDALTTQTIPPTNVNASGQSSSEVGITWAPIVYTGDVGHYDIWYALQGDGNKVYAGSTTSKSENTFVVEGLASGTAYDFYVLTYTAPHDLSQNDLYSNFSAAVTASTDTSVVSNPGFEFAGATNAKAASWAGQNLVKDKRVTNKPEKNRYFSRSGNAAFRFNGNAGVYSKIKQVLTPTINSATSVKFSAWVEGKNLVVGMKFKLVLTYSDLTKDRIKLSVPKGSFDYTHFTDALITSKSVVKSKIIIGMKGSSGKFFVDDVDVVINDTPALLPLAESAEGFRR